MHPYMDGNPGRKDTREFREVNCRDANSVDRTGCAVNNGPASLGAGVFDPFEFVVVGFVTGINQASNSNPSSGERMQGYAMRYGTAYADNAIENFMAAWFSVGSPPRSPFLSTRVRWFLAPRQTCCGPRTDCAR